MGCEATAAREIALAFGVPPMLLGLPGDATYANYAEAHRAFYRLTVLPLVSRVASAVAWWLSEHLGAEIDRDYDWALGLDFAFKPLPAFAIAVVLGAVSGIGLLAAFYRPPAPSGTDA